MENKTKKSFDFKTKKNNTINSLREIEFFLNRACKCCKFGSIAKFLKK